MTYKHQKKQIIALIGSCFFFYLTFGVAMASCQNDISQMKAQIKKDGSISSSAKGCKIYSIGSLTSGAGCTASCYAVTYVYPNITQCSWSKGHWKEKLDCDIPY